MMNEEIQKAFEVIQQGEIILCSKPNQYREICDMGQCLDFFLHLKCFF